MGFSGKRSRGTRDSDGDSEDEFDSTANGNVAMEDLDYEDNDFSDEEEEEEDDDEAEEEGEEDGEQNDNHNNDEMEDLEKEYRDLRNQELDLLKNLKRHKDEDVLKGQAVKNQKALWDKALEFRFLLQKTFSSSNRLPLEPIRSSFCESDGVSVAYDDLISSSKKTLDSLLELQEALIEKNPAISESSNGKSAQPSKKHPNDSEDIDEEWLRISQTNRRIVGFRDKSLDKWQRKAQVTTGAAAIKNKLQAFNQNISEQVAAYMRDPSRMVKQMQQRRSAVATFGAIHEINGAAKVEEANPDGDPELLDDSEFYQQLLKEFFETIDPNSTEMAFYALKRLRTKKRKVVDRRASKSRKIRYNVHEKIVNFMAPRRMDLPPMASKLFENLFGLKT
ncbi:hypothetical protein K2173_011308 [Erythroxylum novogranatense]|uniref:Protein AATF n=1 Tax=Erythroxylum novogranatense TaxID=1862640 RepID=A0AAV8S9M3_9ROSI|nr:hypothetical protein K2173_011308 [Erythroxylum novogranatense]